MRGDISPFTDSACCYLSIGNLLIILSSRTAVIPGRAKHCGAAPEKRALTNIKYPGTICNCRPEITGNRARKPAVLLQRIPAYAGSIGRRTGVLQGQGPGVRGQPGRAATGIYGQPVLHPKVPGQGGQVSRPAGGAGLRPRLRRQTEGAGAAERPPVRGRATGVVRLPGAGRKGRPHGP